MSRQVCHYECDYCGKVHRTCELADNCCINPPRLITINNIELQSIIIDITDGEYNLNFSIDVTFLQPLNINVNLIYVIANGWSEVKLQQEFEEYEDYISDVLNNDNNQELLRKAVEKYISENNMDEKLKISM